MFHSVTKTTALPPGQGGTFEVDGRLVALFNRDGEFFAIDDRCPHQGASLGAGCLDDEGAVTCPWHAWRFSVIDGKWCDNPRLGVDTFEVRVVGEDIQVRVDPVEP
jgi:nitrite reductase (NADH) small subunit/3-phenylpropionate/trans-cinnamate dioxygenase ferredoxin subunit